MGAKVLLIGLDAMDGSLVRQWVGEGVLPNFATLAQRFQWEDTVNPVGFLASVSVWPSFFTGCSPAVHGRYGYRQLVPGTYRTRVTSPLELLADPFWQILSDHGKRVAILDVPSGPLSEKLNGIQVANWGPHDIEGEFGTYPHTYAETFRTKYGIDPVGQCDRGGHGQHDFERFRTSLLKRIEKRLEFSRELLESENWDLFCTVFNEPHCAGHQAWHLHDLEHPGYGGRLTKEVGDPIRDIYMAIDQAIGGLLQCVDDETRIMIYSSQGMGSSFSGEHLINAILSRLGSDGRTSSSGRFYDYLFSLRGKIPAFVHEPFGKLKNRLRNTLLAGDWASRDCFSVPPSVESVSCLRFNLVGRDPKGRIHPGPELDKCYDELRQYLESLVDPETGKPLVRQIVRTADIYVGDACVAFPDVLVEWYCDRPINAVCSPDKGLVEGVRSSHRSGDHTRKGFVLIGGPGVGELERDMSSVVLAPMIARWLDVGDEAFSNALVARRE